jgi:hypothetical protein
LLYVPAPDEFCGLCGEALIICEHRDRLVQRSDDLYRVVRQLKWCQTEGCAWFHKTYRPPVDLRFALPQMTFGTDIVLELGERHLTHRIALSAIGREFTERGVLMSQRTTCNLLRVYLALARAARGDDEQFRQRLRAQGGIVLMADGVQFDNSSPVLYLVWDAISGTPLFGERKPFRGADDLVPLLERVKAMGVPVIAVVSDKEKGLVPAISEMFPNVRHQLCQFHFLKNCALGMERDLHDLSDSVAGRAERVAKITKKLHDKGFDSVENGAGDERVTATSLPEEQLAAELCAMARHASRASGRAPLNPPEFVRHNELERVRAAVQNAKKKRRAKNTRS